MESKHDNEIDRQILSIGNYLQHRKGRSRSQETILKILELNGPMSQKTLQEELKIKSASISEIVTKLEKRGHVSKSRSKLDSRTIDLSITGKGKQKLTQIKREGKDNLYDCLDEEEKEELIRLLCKINEKIMMKNFSEEIK